MREQIHAAKNQRGQTIKKMETSLVLLLQFFVQELCAIPVAQYIQLNYFE
jgi:hypothetical protein